MSSNSDNEDPYNISSEDTVGPLESESTERSPLISTSPCSSHPEPQSNKETAKCSFGMVQGLSCDKVNLR